MKVMRVLWLLSFVTLCPAQDIRGGLTAENKPDLTGTWVLDMPKSDFGPHKGDLAYDELTLIISQHEPEIRITRKTVKNKKERSQALAYYSDGRGESNPEIAGKEVVKSTTKWDGDALVSHGTHRVQLFDDALVFETTDRWELSADGNTLTHITVSTPPRRVSGRPTDMPENILEAKRIFRRVS